MSIPHPDSVGKVRTILLFETVFHDSVSDCTKLTLEAVRKGFWSRSALMSCFTLASHSRSQEEIFSFKCVFACRASGSRSRWKPNNGIWLLRPFRTASRLARLHCLYASDGGRSKPGAELKNGKRE